MTLLMVGLLILADFAALTLIVLAMIAHALEMWKHSTRRLAVSLGMTILLIQCSIGNLFQTGSLSKASVTALLVTSILATLVFAFKLIRPRFEHAVSPIKVKQFAPSRSHLHLSSR